MHTFINTSFELVAGTAAVLTSTSVEPFALAAGMTLLLGADGAVESYLFDIGSQSSIVSVDGTFALVDGDTLDIAIDGLAPVTVTFLAADVDDINRVTVVEAISIILPVVPGIFGLQDGDALRIGSVTKGSTSLINITGGSAAAAFGFPAGVAGVDYFVDITAATAAEVVAQILAQTTLVTPSVSAGAVVITNIDEGDEACIQIEGGSAQAVFLFPTEQVCGISRHGWARGWNIISVTGVWDFADFDVVLPWTTPYDMFDRGWSGNEDDLIAIGPLTLAGFSGFLFDTFDWWVTLYELPALAAAGFDISSGAASFDDFSAGWPTSPGNEGDVSVIGVVTYADFHTTVVAYEDFSREWPQEPGNEGDVTVIGALTEATFGTTDAFEDFGGASVVAVQYRVTTAVVNAGDQFNIILDGVEHPYSPALATTDAATALELANAITDGPTANTASAVGSDILITQDVPGAPLVYSKVASPPTSLVLILGDAVDPETGWPGTFYNPAI
ncbi:MAG: hypothetical protein E6R03_13345 [Hyphomicrobiaceae bacterium]|nr:MAG: hypothetical protein E6R03_13345 [Hyphomicrobiaceae bacterium]